MLIIRFIHDPNSRPDFSIQSVHVAVLEFVIPKSSRVSVQFEHSICVGMSACRLIRRGWLNLGTESEGAQRGDTADTQDHGIPH